MNSKIEAYLCLKYEKFPSYFGEISSERVAQIMKEANSYSYLLGYDPAEKEFYLYIKFPQQDIKSIALTNIKPKNIPEFIINYQKNNKTKELVGLSYQDYLLKNLDSIQSFDKLEQDIKSASKFSDIPYFYGIINSTEASKILAKAPPFSYLLRYSPNYKEYYFTYKRDYGSIANFVFVPTDTHSSNSLIRDFNLLEKCNEANYKTKITEQELNAYTRTEYWKNNNKPVIEYHSKTLSHSSYFFKKPNDILSKLPNDVLKEIATLTGGELTHSEYKTAALNIVNASFKV